MNAHARPSMPPKRKGQVCYFCRWHRDGHVLEARYRPVGKTEPDGGNETLARVQPKTISRSALTAELKARQGMLEL